MKTEELGLAVPRKTGGTRISKGKRKDMPIRGQDEHKQKHAMCVEIMWTQE